VGAIDTIVCLRLDLADNDTAAEEAGFQAWVCIKKPAKQRV